jgi:NAD(P)-dependent dehydrogenase (short-subunit alcohol dehydrogenase family)
MKIFLTFNASSKNLRSKKMTTETRLMGQVALITGGGGEIGSAIAYRFVQEGASVIIGDINLNKAEATVDKIIAEGGKAFAAELDVGQEESARNGVNQAIASFGKLTTLVNVAATVTPDGTAETLSLAQWENALRINLTGTFIMCKYAMPMIRQAGGGSVINIASQLGHMGIAGRSPYCTTKAALIKYTEILAMDYARDNIRVNSISPGFILTERSSRRSGGKENAARLQGPKHLLNKPGSVEDIAAGAAFLASSDAAFVTGTDILIDGGYVKFKGMIGSDGRPTI